MGVAQEKMEEEKKEPYTAIVAGATGATGKQLTRELFQSPLCSSDKNDDV